MKAGLTETDKRNVATGLLRVIRNGSLVNKMLQELPHDANCGEGETVVSVGENLCRIVYTENGFAINYKDKDEHYEVNFKVLKR